VLEKHHTPCGLHFFHFFDRLTSQIKRTLEYSLATPNSQLLNSRSSSDRDCHNKHDALEKVKCCGKWARTMISSSPKFLIAVFIFMIFPRRYRAAIVFSCFRTTAQFTVPASCTPTRHCAPQSPCHLGHPLEITSGIALPATRTCMHRITQHRHVQQMSQPQKQNQTQGKTVPDIQDSQAACAAPSLKMLL
jgi:hypothetical protein